MGLCRLGKLLVVPLSTAAEQTSPQNSSDIWFEELDKLNFVLRPKLKEKDSLYQPVKIAILDTGVSDDYEDNVKGYKDFVDRNKEKLDDKTAHGTGAFLLVQKVYNMAEIYVGKVFEGAHATENTVTLMAEAVRHATKSWHVNIIIMPSGFKSDNIDLETAIDEARHAGILIFAAASNYGNAMDIAFPGRLYIDLKLFCMFSTNSSVRAHPKFNPSVSAKARYSFAILGEEVKIPKQEKLVSGTSYATVIGGALAARILDFAQHKDNRGRIRRADKLKTVEGMSAVFETMVGNAVDNGYHCLAPWKILPDEITGEDTEPMRLRGRAYICETISRALEEMHRR
jgi:subtilisin family serine protease